MAGLVSYASSDEEDLSEKEGTPQAPVVGKREGARDPVAQDKNGGEPKQSSAPAEVDGPVMGPSLPAYTASMGPSLPLAEEDDEVEGRETVTRLPDLENDDSGRPSSPFTATRALLRDLTLPPVPNLDIPPSPPGTPPPSLATLNAKFETFLELKRKKGTHFNARLAQSTAMKNPALMDKLLGFVGMQTSFDGAGDGKKDGDPVAQYATTLEPDLWDPAAFPDWAYRQQLRQSQEDMRKERARTTGEPVEFVSASEAAAPTKPASRAGTPMGGGGGTGKRKTRFDT